MTLGQPARLDASALIDLAERATELSSAEWSIALLSRAYPEATREALLALPLGARDRLVLAIRSRLRGGALRSEPVCGACGGTYELTLDPALFGLAGDAPWPEPERRSVRIGDREVALRPVVLGDILAVENVPDPERAAGMLAARILSEEVDLPLGAMAEALEALDPAADVWIEAACPECQAMQAVAFDAVHFVALELRQISWQILRDVVDLARVFHWSEADILALPDHRRAYYVAEALA